MAQHSSRANWSSFVVIAALWIDERFKPLLVEPRVGPTLRRWIGSQCAYFVPKHGGYLVTRNCECPGKLVPAALRGGLPATAASYYLPEGAFDAVLTDVRAYLESLLSV